ncbi:hypothetical protein PAPHI01_0685 [Pancytospora philotis]|nr:hypothetical protein PAPHI01_0685 [Pancytospora philotis]
MRVLSTALLLAGSFSAARLSLTDTMKAVRKSVGAASGGKEVHINPEGSLNILRAHSLVGNDILAKKRHYSAPGTIAYRLVHDAANDTYVYEESPDDGPIRDLTGADPKAMAYLRAYHETLGIMFRAVDRTVYVSNGHHKSFYKYLSVLADDDKRAHFLAMLLVLAEVGSGVIKVAVHKEKAAPKAKRLSKRPASIEFTCPRSGCVLLSSPLEAAGKNWKPSYAENALAGVDFFATHGGVDVRREYGLEHYSDSPGSLILTYIYEFAGDHEFIGKVFGHVDATLRKICADDELAAVHARFFASSSDICPEYAKAYGVLEKIGEIDGRSVFPFSRTNPPRKNRLVYLYDEASQSVCSETSYSDCVEIALYNLFCCMLFDPETRKYSTAHLKAKGCNSTERLVDFFTKESSVSDSTSLLGIHQEWARVAQDLTLSLGASSGTEVGAEDSIPITYKRSGTKGIRVELHANLGNYLVALVKIAGLPDEITRELQGLLWSSVARNLDDEVDCGKISDSIAEALNCISLMRVDVRLFGLYLKDAMLYGTLNLSFQPQQSSTGAQPQTVELRFAPSHASFVHKLNDIVLSKEERKFFEAYDGAGADSGSRLLLGLVDESVARFLSTADGTFLPNAHIGKVETADGSIACHNALNDWMARAELLSPEDLLIAFDQLSPAVAAFVQRNKALFGQMRKLKSELDGPAVGSDSKARIAKQLKDSQDRIAGSPLIILAANILGRVPLTDEYTRKLFFEVLMRQHADERDFLFPQLRIPRNAYLPMGKEKSLDSPSHIFSFVSQHELPNTLAGYLNLKAAAGCAPIDPERCYPKTVEYFKKYTILPSPHHQELKTLVKHCDRNTLQIMKENYIFKTCEVGSDQYCAMAACLVYVAASVGRYEEICGMCDKWNDTECSPFKVSVARFLREYAERRPLSALIVERAFPNGPEARQLRALLRIFAFFAYTDATYDGIYEVFVVYRDILDASFAAGYCATLIGSYREICSDIESDNHPLWHCGGLPIDPLRVFVAKLRALYFRAADSGPEPENAFIGVDERLRDLGTYAQEVLDGLPEW